MVAMFAVALCIQLHVAATVRRLQVREDVQIMKKPFSSREPPTLELVASSRNVGGPEPRSDSLVVGNSYDRTAYLDFRLPGLAKTQAAGAKVDRAELVFYQSRRNCMQDANGTHELYHVPNPFLRARPALGDKLGEWQPAVDWFTADVTTKLSSAAVFSSNMNFAISTKGRAKSYCKYASERSNNHMHMPRLWLWLSSIRATPVHTAGLPDFSYVGYHQGDVAVPSVRYRQGWKVFRVDNAVGNDDEARILSATAEAQEYARNHEDKGAVVKFGPGTYRMNRKGSLHQNVTIHMSQSRVIWQGEVTRKDRTTIFMEMPHDSKDGSLWNVAPKIIFGEARRHEHLCKVTAKAQKGSRMLSVGSISKLSNQQWIQVRASVRPGSEAYEDLTEHQSSNFTHKWTNVKKSIKICSYHQIKRILNDTHVELVQPLHVTVDSPQHFEVRSWEPITEVGVERIRFLGGWDPTSPHFQGGFRHHGSAIQDFGFSPLRFQNVAHGYVRDVIMENVNSGLIMKSTASCSVLRYRVQGHQGHIALTIQMGSHNYVGFSDDIAGQWHTFGASKPSSGNVIHRTTWQARTSPDFHGSMPHTTLLDVVRGGWNGRYGGAIQNMPNHLGGLVLWNIHTVADLTADGFVSIDGEKAQNRNPAFLNPTIKGWYGAVLQLPDFPTASAFQGESYAWPVQPESLYETQLATRRGGSLPQWLSEEKEKWDALEMEKVHALEKTPAGLCSTGHVSSS